MVNSLVIIGPGWPLRGGLSAFDEQLARTFNDKKIDSSIVSFSLQYPSLLFPGSTQYTSDPAPKEVTIFSIINSINPFNWIRVGLRLKKQKPDLIIVRYWIPFLAPCLGTICRIAKSNKHTKVISIVDNMIPHEKRIGDRQLTNYFAKSVDGFLTMSQKVSNDVQRFSDKPIVMSPHPIFAHFGNPITKAEARNIIGQPEEDKIILFFGFIRHYKGLDMLIKAMATDTIKNTNIKLMVVGEFYENAQPYYDLIKSLGLEDRIILHTQFVPDEEVKNYVCSADFIIQPYRNATQSGVTPLAYHFEIPMLVTNVGALADTVPHGKVGFVVDSTIEAIASGIGQLYEKGTDYFKSNIQAEKKKYSWAQMADNFLILQQQL
jgi:glycosyltransferase involved in cell wall biosynthesis